MSAHTRPKHKATGIGGSMMQQTHVRCRRQPVRAGKPHAPHKSHKRPHPLHKQGASGGLSRTGRARAKTADAAAAEAGLGEDAGGHPPQLGRASVLAQGLQPCDVAGSVCSQLAGGGGAVSGDGGAGRTFVHFPGHGVRDVFFFFFFFFLE